MIRQQAYRGRRGGEEDKLEMETWAALALVHSYGPDDCCRCCCRRRQRPIASPLFLLALPPRTKNLAERLFITLRLAIPPPLRRLHICYLVPLKRSANQHRTLILTSTLVISTHTHTLTLTHFHTHSRSTFAALRSIMRNLLRLTWIRIFVIAILITTVLSETNKMADFVGSYKFEKDDGKFDDFLKAIGEF